MDMATVVLPNQLGVRFAGLDPHGCMGRADPTVAGCFVEKIHEGIEYSTVRLAIETFDILKHNATAAGEKLENPPSARHIEALKNKPGEESARWTCLAAGELGLPVPTVAAAAGVRVLSEFEKRNDISRTPHRQPAGRFDNDSQSVTNELRNALRTAVLLTYAQGVAVLVAGSAQFGFDLNLPETIREWKVGGEICGGLLDEIAAAVRAVPNLRNLLDDDDLSASVMARQECLRHAICRADFAQTPSPLLRASLDYLDSYRGAWLPGNLIEAPRMAVAPTPPRLAGLVRR
jgi:6-phosphogluconate dehydrogenase